MFFYLYEYDQYGEVLGVQSIVSNFKLKFSESVLNGKMDTFATNIFGSLSDNLTPFLLKFSPLSIGHSSP